MKMNKVLLIACFLVLVSSCKKDDVAPDRRYIYYNESGVDVSFVVFASNGVVTDSSMIANGASRIMTDRLTNDYNVRIYYDDRLAEVYSGFNLLAKPKDPRNYDNYEIADTGSRLFYYFYTFTKSDYENSFK